MDLQFDAVHFTILEGQVNNWESYGLLLPHENIKFGNSSIKIHIKHHTYE